MKQMYIGQTGGVQLILSLMFKYPKDLPLLESCCYTLSILSFNNLQNMAMIVENNGSVCVCVCVHVYVCVCAY